MEGRAIDEVFSIKGFTVDLAGEWRVLIDCGLSDLPARFWNLLLADTVCKAVVALVIPFSLLHVLAPLHTPPSSAIYLILNLPSFFSLICCLFFPHLPSLIYSPHVQ